MAISSKAQSQMQRPGGTINRIEDAAKDTPRCDLRFLKEPWNAVPGDGVVRRSK
ncbi:hypothetical protein TWF788_005670 [Orbilia oligospora]|uniref:Uncharacterized protein n=1 Tax=Orbilia oligospora TaxID=2813651 RepID=A0A6G1MJW8_ORBOL|nr:hypothetical protein TWF788_005670 [Orbilia oligospora]KAF3226968.1 hypothetical protein TWF191_004327 [Orbilia oligospora]KAF3261621.1 hypothetical protein TWF192_008084 [Orbilia oligospora]